MSFERNQWEAQERERLQGTSNEYPPDRGYIAQSRQQSATSTVIKGTLFHWAFCLHIVGEFVSSKLNWPPMEPTDPLFNDVAVYSSFSYFTLGIVATLGLFYVFKAPKVQAACMVVGGVSAGVGCLLYLNLSEAIDKSLHPDIAFLQTLLNKDIVEAMIFGVIGGDVLLGFYRWTRSKLGIGSSGI